MEVKYGGERMLAAVSLVTLDSDQTHALLRSKIATDPRKRAFNLIVPHSALSVVGCDPGRMGWANPASVLVGCNFHGRATQWLSGDQ